MYFTLTRPCATCPFRTDITFYLRPERTEEILRAITQEDQTFACHKTTHLGEWDDEEGVYFPSGNEQHCAGALILIEKAGIANAMVQIAERLGLYHPLALDMSAPVFATPQAMQHHMTALHYRSRR